MKKIFTVILSAIILFSMSVPAFASNLSIPTITYIEADGSCIYIEWDSVYSADSYNLYRSSNGSEYNFLDSSSDNSYLDSDVEYGKRYYYKVQAKSNSNYSYLSNYKSAKVIWTDKHFPTNDLDRPKLITFTDEDQDCIWLLWDEIEGANVYFIYRSTSKNGPYELKYVEDKSVLTFDKNIKKNKR